MSLLEHGRTYTGTLIDAFSYRWICASHSRTCPGLHRGYQHRNPLLQNIYLQTSFQHPRKIHFTINSLTVKALITSPITYSFLSFHNIVSSVTPCLIFPCLHLTPFVHSRHLASRLTINLHDDKNWDTRGQDVPPP